MKYTITRTVEDFKMVVSVEADNFEDIKAMLEIQVSKSYKEAKSV